MGDEFRLRVDDVRKLLLEHVRRVFMIALPGGTQQRLIGNILQQDMFKGEFSRRRTARWIQNFRLHELLQTSLQVRIGKRRDVLD